MIHRIIILSVFLLIGISLPGFAGKMIPGKLYSLKDGAVISCSIEYSEGQGKMEAFNSLTGEIFTGMYTGVFVNDKYARCKGILIGDKGTVIALEMEVNLGNTWDLPFGYGDGIDNNDQKYQYHTTKN